MTKDELSDLQALWGAIEEFASALVTCGHLAEDRAVRSAALSLTDEVEDLRLIVQGAVETGADR